MCNLLYIYYKSTDLSSVSAWSLEIKKVNGYTGNIHSLFMRDIFHGLFVELPVSIVANLPWSTILTVLILLFALQAVDFPLTQLVKEFFTSF